MKKNSQKKKLKYYFQKITITDFTGSNGFALVLENEALMWTDSRYYIQVKFKLKKRLKNNWKDIGKWKKWKGDNHNGTTI